MKRMILLFVLTLATPAAAEDDKLSQGLSLFSEATRLMLEGLGEELDPALQGLKGWLEDLTAYEVPEVLPNGDILIRRKTPMEVDPDPYAAPETGQGAEIEL